LALELEKRGLSFDSEKTIKILYEGNEVGRYRPDFVVEDKILIEVKVVPFFTKEHKLQFWRYLKGSSYRVGFLVNFGGKRLEIIRRVYDTARRRTGPRGSA
jgi:GxxExxY protein